MNNRKLELQRSLISAVASAIPLGLTPREMEELLSDPEKLKARVKMVISPPDEMIYRPKVWKTIILHGLNPIQTKLMFWVRGGAITREVIARRYHALLTERGVECDDLLYVPERVEYSLDMATETVDLVSTTPREMGFYRNPMYDAFCGAAVARGLKLCPPEVGPEIILQHQHLPDGLITIGMGSYCAGSGMCAWPQIYAINKKDEQIRLGGVWSTEVRLDDQFVFIKG